MVGRADVIAVVGDNVRGIYNQEVSQVEFELKRSINHYNELIRLLKNAEGYTINPFVTQSEVGEYRDIKVEWIQDPNNEPFIKPIYFDSIKVYRFIEKTSEELKELLNDYDIEYYGENRNMGQKL